MSEFICPHCGRPIYDDEALLCLYCGENLQRGIGALGKMKYSVHWAIVALVAIIVLIAFALLAFPAEAKQSDLAGSWYTSSPEKLKSELEGYMAGAPAGEIEGDVIGVMVPHAGFRYSGPVAARVFKAIENKGAEKVIVVGFTHRRYFPDRIAVLTDEFFSTPLGSAPIDPDITRRLIEYHSNIQSMPQAFIEENSVEMEIPFIQTVFKDARLVIVALCDQRKQNWKLLANALHYVLRDEEAYVIIASSDMSHYLSYDSANEKDAETIAAIEAFDADSLYRYSISQHDGPMCGYGAVCAVMEASGKLGADRAEILKYANSGDTSGMKDRVVGYLSAVFVKSGDKKKEGHAMLDGKQREELLKIARDAIREYLETGKRLEVATSDEALMKDMGVFVTLHKQGELRGCIGNMVATGPLCLAVRDMAIAAATGDPRFAPLTLKEMDDVDLEISVLSPMKKIDDYNEIEMGKHGVMVRAGRRSGVYLPQVADETGWNREEFMNSLCEHKAGIPRNSWKTGECDIYVFTAEVFGEKG